MNNPLSRLIPLLVAVALIAPVAASADDASQAERDALASQAQQYFHAVINGSTKGILAVTTPGFTLTTLEGQKMNAYDLAVRHQIMNIEFGNIMGGAKVNSLTTNGNTATTVTMLHSMADTFADGNGSYTSSLDAIHKMTWINKGGTWKLASDKVLRSSTTQ
jgi:hypothetical protein